MNNKIVIYSDESCHIQGIDGESMAIASLYLKNPDKTSILLEINDYLTKNKISGEIKWSKISNANLNIYKGLVDILHSYSINNKLWIRTILSKNKNNLIKSYDEWYRISYFYLVRHIIDVFPSNKIFHLLFDRKDKGSGYDAYKISTYLHNKFYKKYTILATTEDSKKHRLIQLADIIAGAMTYKDRKLTTSAAKLNMINYIENLFSIELNKTTLFKEKRFNTFVWGGHL